MVIECYKVTFLKPLIAEEVKYMLNLIGNIIAAED
jgi:hypothetical protein